MFQIKYNSQMDNDTFGGKLKASIQCFYTSAVMFISHWNKNYELPAFEKLYVDDTEASVGKSGIAETVKGWSGRSGGWWIVHLAAIKKILPMQKVVFNSKTKVDDLISILKSSPVIFGTNKMGGLPGGHIVLVVGYDLNTDSFILEDPFGNPNTNYKDRNGHQVKVKRDYLKKYADPYSIYATQNFPTDQKKNS